LPYLGRWEGDDEWGAYLVLKAATIDANRRLLLHKQSKEAAEP
jgi:hypothetical protein